MKKRYNDFNSYLRGLYGERVQKITVDAGLTCPNRDGNISEQGCIYCNAKGSGTGAYSKGMSIKEQLIKSRSYIAKKYKAKKYLVYFQSFTNTYAPVARLKTLYNEALNAIDGVVGLSIGTRPDCINEKILDLLEEYGGKYLIWIEYGLQSANDNTLAFINRGHDFSCFKKAVKMTRQRGIKVCAHVILGLPGETKGDMINTAKAVSDVGIDGIKIHLLYVIKDTPLEKLYKEGCYKCLTQEEYAGLVCDFLEYLPSNVIIQRITGDPHTEELVAPEWALDKTGTMKMISHILEVRDTWQGKNSLAPCLA